MTGGRLRNSYVGDPLRQQMISVSSCRCQSIFCADFTKMVDRRSISANPMSLPLMTLARGLMYFFRME